MMSRGYRDLSRRMTATALLVALVPLWLLGVLIYWYFSQSNEDQLREALRSRAESKADTIELFLTERIAQLEILVNTSSLEDLLSIGRLPELFNLLNRRSHTFLDLGLIDSHGDHLVYVGPYTLEHKNYKDTEWFRRTMLTGVYVSDVFLGFRGVPHFVIAVKRQNPAGDWILRATIDSDVFNRLVRSAQVGQSGDAFIVNSGGRYQTPPRFQGELLGQCPLDMRSVPAGLSASVRETPNGNRRITGYAWLSRPGWLLVIDQDPRENLGPLSTAGTAELVVLGLASLFITGAVLFLVRLLVGQLERKDRERSALDAQLAHQSRLVSLGRMAAGVAHEINNPLAAIGELAGVMEDVMLDEAVAHRLGEEESTFKENLTKIQNQVERAKTVTHRMLNFARRMQPRVEEMDLNQVVAESYSFVEKESFFRGVEVKLNFEESLPPVTSDRAQLQQVFLNLLNNALDAVGEKGHIAVKTHRNGNMVEVSVADDGPGIPQEVADRIFDPFFTTKEPGQGTGLGLSISHSIMEKLGGAISFESTPGEGTVFTVSIPVGYRERP